MRYTVFFFLLLMWPAAAQDAGVTPMGVTAIQQLIATARTAAMTSSSVPSVGPGAGLCQETIVPSNQITSAGTTGMVGTCSAIIQCGTSASYVVKQFNVGSGC